MSGWWSTVRNRKRCQNCQSWLAYTPLYTVKHLLFSITFWLQTFFLQITACKHWFVIKSYSICEYLSKFFDICCEICKTKLVCRVHVYDIYWNDSLWFSIGISITTDFKDLLNYICVYLFSEKLTDPTFQNQDVEVGFLRRTGSNSSLNSIFGPEGDPHIRTCDNCRKLLERRNEQIEQRTNKPIVVLLYEVSSTVIEIHCK